MPNSHEGRHHVIVKRQQALDRVVEPRVELSTTQPCPQHFHHVTVIGREGIRLITLPLPAAAAAADAAGNSLAAAADSERHQRLGAIKSTHDGRSQEIED